MLRLRRVHIRRFRSVASDARLEFGPGQVFLLGRNGSGRSTLLDLLGCLISCNFSAMRHESEPIDIEWELNWPIVSENGPGHGSLELRLIAGVDKPARPVITSEEYAPMGQRSRKLNWGLDGVIRVQWADVSFAARFRVGAHQFLSISVGADSAPWVETRDSLSPFDAWFLINLFRAMATLQNTGMASAAWFWFVFDDITSHRFDEALDVFNAITGDPKSSFASAGIRRDKDRFSSNFVPSRAGVGSRETRSVVTGSSRADDIATAAPLLREMAVMLGAEAVEVRPRLSQENKAGMSIWRGFDVFVDWSGGIRHRHDNLSFGQKRLIAFLWYRAVYEKAPLLTDELTNGMYAAWVSEIVDLLKGHQAFHAIQNPLLLNISGLGTEDEIPGHFVLCVVEATDAGRVWHWRNPTPEESHVLRVSWDAGHQKLSDILFSRGLW